MSALKNFINLLKPTGQYMQHQVNTQKLYALTKRYLCDNNQRLMPLTA